MIRKLYAAWDRIFFAPISPVPIATFRILYGLCVFATLLLLHSDWLNWFGANGWVSQKAMTAIEPGVRLNLFHIMPQNNAWIASFFWIFLAFTVLLIFGLWTRLSTAVVFVCLASVQQRNLFITNGGDTFLRVTGFFLIFAPAGAALSLDRWLRVRRGLERVGDILPRAPWAQRIIQFQLALLYFCSFLWKLKGGAWRSGTALYYVLHLHEIQRFPVPMWMQHSTLLHIGSWAALLFELAFAALIWFRPFRYPLLLAGLLFHLSLEYALNLPMIEWDILAAYVLFLDPADLLRVGGIVRTRLRWRGRRDQTMPVSMASH